MDRTTVITRPLDQARLGLEIGPLHSPVVSKASGVPIETMDHLDTVNLIQKYRDRGIPEDVLARIEPVDHVWNGEPIADVAGERRFAWIIASHVIEHVPDIVGFLNGCARALTQNGLLALAVPDMRTCFDYLRAPTSLGQVIDAHLRGDRRPSPGAVAEFRLNACRREEAIGWMKGDARQLYFIHTTEDARSQLHEVHNKSAYYDIHVWCFTPTSFRMLIEDLFVLGLTDLREVEPPTIGSTEFVIHLSRQGCGPREDRMSLAKQRVHELLQCDDPVPRLVEASPASETL